VHVCIYNLLFQENIFLILVHINAFDHENEDIMNNLDSSDREDIKPPPPIIETSLKFFYSNSYVILLILLFLY